MCLTQRVDGQVVKEKTSIKALEKFQKTVTDLLSLLSAGDGMPLGAGEGDGVALGDLTQADQGSEAKGQCLLSNGPSTYHLLLQIILKSCWK